MRRLMEQRSNFRKHVDARVILDVAGLGAVEGRTCDVSYGGMRLETKPWFLSPNAKVRVTVVLRPDMENTPRTIDARVTYMNRHGCGLTFEDFDQETFSLLHTLIHLEAEIMSPQQEGAVARA